jgi:hypothetical protein
MVVESLDLLLVSAGGDIRDKRGRATGHLNSQFMIILQKHDRANISKREDGKISKNSSIVENNMRIRGIITKVT